MIILALIVGFFAAVAAFFLHRIINQIVLLLTSSFDRTGANWLYLVYPVVGIYLTSLFVRYIVKDNISHGITRILYAISTKPLPSVSVDLWVLRLLSCSQALPSARTSDSCSISTVRCL